MAKRSHKILVVEPDPDLLEILVETLSLRFDSHVTCVATAESCLDVELTDPHDLVIAEMELADGQQEVAAGRHSGTGLDGLQLAEHLVSLSARPIILLADKPTCHQAVEALRLGVHDLLLKPFPAGQLLDTVQRVLQGFEMQRQHLAKYHRMRELLRRVIRERRDLNQRIELICRDLVGAHRRLAHRVLEYQDTRSSQSA